MLPHNEETLESELRRLVQSGLVHRRGFGAQTRYAFKHALIRDAAYDSLLRRERQLIHLRIATAMDEDKRAGSKAAQSEEIAHHYMAGEQHDRAFECWLEAGQLAIGRSAYAEAIGHFQHALQALEAQPPSPDRDRREISLRSVLAVSLGVIRGQSSPEVEAVYDRILTLTGPDRQRAAGDLFRAVELLRQPRQVAPGERAWTATHRLRRRA